MHKKSVATKQQLENLSKGKPFVKGDERCTAYREKARKKAEATKARRKKWREQKQFAAAHRVLHTVTLPNGKKNSPYELRHGTGFVQSRSGYFDGSCADDRRRVLKMRVEKVSKSFKKISRRMLAHV